MAKSVPVPRGHIPVLIGEGKELQRVVVHRKMLQHPYFTVLLELAAMEFGHNQKGGQQTMRIADEDLGAEA
nr:unnamed protein product [Digitaria exilis]